MQAILLEVLIEVTFVSPFPRLERNHQNGGNFDWLPDFLITSNRTARSIDCHRFLRTPVRDPELVAIIGSHLNGDSCDLWGMSKVVER